MTAQDEDPEYEAQLKDALGDQGSTWPDPGDDQGDEEMGEFVKDTDNQSEDGVLNDVPSFKMKLPAGGSQGGHQVIKDEEDLSGIGSAGDNKAMSEDARSISTGDDSPSAQGSEITVSGPGIPNNPNGYGYLSPARAFSPSRGFDIRQHQRLSSLSSLTGRSPTPSSVPSRMSSISLDIHDTDMTSSESPNVPWEVVRWKKLRKIAGQAFSEIGKRKFGTPTVLAVSSSFSNLIQSSGVIAIGTSKGLVLIFDFLQSLKHVIGVGTKAAQSGSVTALTLSADHTVLLCGHSSGEIFTWDLSKSAQPLTHTHALTPEQISTSRHDGHLAGSAILHVDFLGLGHGAFVTADELGMAFVHAVSRKLVVPSTSTTRILGRYPERLGSTQRPVKPHKPSCVLGMGALPLGSVKFVTDEMQLVAMLSPYKLVVVSIIPFPQTQLRVARPKRASSEGSVLAGCIAWYPCVKADSTNETKEPFMKPKLAYTWDRYLAIRQVSELPHDNEDGKEGPPRLQFRLIKEWMGEETIVAIRWLLQQVLVLLTVSQRLLILDTSTMQVTASCDLLMKQVLHHDRFSRHMNNFPAVADAYYSSFHTYKRKFILLCAEDISVGSLLTWADRVAALVEAGDFIEAINLTSSYYNGRSEKITLGLPENDDERHAVVQDKLTEMIIASLKYTFSHKPEASEDDYVHAEVAQQKLIKELTAASIDACLSMDSLAFMFDEVYEVFEEYDQANIFIEVLEPYILKDRIQDVPPSIMKDITSHFVERNLHQRLEQVICHINPASLDIDQITSMCRQHGLYDALSYVYNNALKDYITPMVEFVGLVREFFVRHRQNSKPVETIDLKNDERASIAFEAFKVFPYLSYILTGRIYPTGEEFPESEAYDAKQSIYYFLFSGRTLSWPRDRGHLVRTTEAEESSEPTFPYLRLFLRFDAPTLFQAMDEAFEDRFLNGPSESSNGTPNGLESFGRAINRQFIVNIFLEVMTSEPTPDLIYLYMFIARNLPKYPQFILLPGTTIEGILMHLCTYGQTEMAEEAQLAAEYLLSVFKPSDSEKMIRACQEARFYKILKTTLRAEGRYAELLDVFLRDEDKVDVFDCADGLLRGGTALTSKQRDVVKGFLIDRLEELVTIDCRKTAEMFERHIPERQKDIVEQLRGQPFQLFTYLDTIISQSRDSPTQPSWITNDIRETYISLMSEFRPIDLVQYLETLNVGDFQIENILPVLEKYDVIDAVVLVLRRAGMTKEAMHKVAIHLTILQRRLSRILLQRMVNADAESLVSEIRRHAFVGADLCETFSKETTVKSVAPKREKGTTRELNDAEQMWLTLLETVVKITTETTAIITGITPHTGNGDIVGQTQILNSLRIVVQDIFTKLLTLTSSQPSSSPARRTSPIHVSFLSILQNFLERLASEPLTDLRAVLSSIFDAYRYERQLIQVASKLVDADLFQDLLAAKRVREKGWRPTSANCMACGRVLFGPGAKGKIFSKWEQRRLQAMETKLAQGESRRLGREKLQLATPDGKGKGKSVDIPTLEADVQVEQTVDDIEGDIVVFGCGHAYHRGCLAELVGTLQIEGEEGSMDGRFRCIVCETH